MLVRVSVVFTGLVEACASVRTVERRGSGARVVLAPPEGDWQVVHGESISVSGCCLTVAGLLSSHAGELPAGTLPCPDMVFDLSSETLDRTWFGDLEPGRLVNLERSLRLSDRLGGHLVSGHVDGVGRIVEIEDTHDGGRRFVFEVPESLERYLIDKGSIAIDGISLTVVAPRGRRFDVAVIPVTLEKTSFGRAKVGERVNLEADLVAKWIERLAQPGLAAR